MMSLSNSNNRSPFTVLQWQGLEHQALIFNYMLAGLPVPPHLLLPIQNTFHSISHPFLSYCSFYGKKIDPEPGRCRRTDGKKWRCSKEAYPDSKYCERHMHRGRNRSRKLVESQTMTQSPSTVTSMTVASGSRGTRNFQNLAANAFGNLQDVTSVTVASGSRGTRNFQNLAANAFGNLQDTGSGTDQYRLSSRFHSLWDSKYLQGLKSEGNNEHSFFSEASESNKVPRIESQLENAWPLMSTRVASHSTLKSSNNSMVQSDYPLHSFLSSEYASGEPVKQEGHPLRPFFNEWPKSKEPWFGQEDEKSNQTALSATQLSISIPMASSDFSATSSQSPAW